MEDEAVRADLGIDVDDHPVRVRQEQASADGATQRNVGARDDAPERVPHHDDRIEAFFLTRDQHSLFCVLFSPPQDQHTVARSSTSLPLPRR